MSEQLREQPGFHVIMVAAAYAEEGLADSALEALRRDAAGNRESRAARGRRWTELRLEAGERPARTA